MEEALLLWKKVKQVLKTDPKFDNKIYNEILAPIQEIHKVQNNYIYLIVQNDLAAYRINKFYLSYFNEALSQVTSERMQFKVISEEDAANEKKAEEERMNTKVNPIEQGYKRRNLRPEYTFESFVTGESNRFAFITAMKVAESPHVTINPLYIFGDVGLGKTHLMMAIGHYALDQNMDTNVVYTSAQQFVEDYFLATSKKNSDAMQAFYNYYSSADILLVDDIQLLANKTGTQEEFFKLFEYLFENNKQIVITSDRQVNELENIMARLKSRFSWGIPVDIKKPDFEHRLNILKRKLSFLVASSSIVDENALEYIAQNFDNNIRELEGALRRFINYCVSFNVDFSLANAKLSLDSIVPQNTTPSIDNFDNIDKVKREVSRYYSVSLSDLASSTRKREVVVPRQIAIYLIRTLYDIPLKKIGEYFGNRDHATVAHAYDKITSLISTDWTVKQDIENIMKSLE